MLIPLINKLIKKFSFSERGGGIAIVTFGVVVLLVFIFTAMNILNAKLIEQGYNNLRDAVMSASSGSVIHLLLKQTPAQTGTQQNSSQGTTITYDPYLQLALGYIINYDAPSNLSTSTTIGVEKNNFIKLDHKKVVNSTLQLIDDTVLNGNGNIYDFNNYQIVMFFIEPNYNDLYKKSFNIIWYTNGAPNNGTLVGPIEGSSMLEMYERLEENINSVVNNDVGGTTKTYNINLNSTGSSNEELIRNMETRPYYLIVVKDFALPTIFNNSTTQDDGTVKGLFGNDARITQPMCALQSGKIERKISE